MDLALANAAAETSRRNRRGRHPVARFLALFKKELALEGSSGLALMNRLLVGPLISLGSSGILYRAFFYNHPGLALGGMSEANYVSFLLFGFLLHSFLNAGYYCFCTKLHQERIGRTLSAIWMAPANRLLSLVALFSMEGVKCLIVLGLTLLLSGPPTHPWLGAVLREAGYLLLLFPFCLLLGYVRFATVLLRPDIGEFLDHFYLAFVLSACPYLPRTLLPDFLQPIASLNPAYHVGCLLRDAWQTSGATENHFLPLAWMIPTVAVAGGLFVWRTKKRLLVKCFG